MAVGSLRPIDVSAFLSHAKTGSSEKDVIGVMSFIDDVGVLVPIGGDLRT